MDSDLKTPVAKREERYSILSAYLNRWASVIVFAAIIALAAGALFVRSDDLAHMQIAIGVSAFDSARSHATLESFAEFCREKGCGDIRWRFLAPGAEPSGCDFYLLPALSAARRLEAGSLMAVLLVAEREAHRYSRSAVFVRSGVRSIPPAPRIIFSAAVSAAGFIEPYRALEGMGVPLEEATIDFSGERPRDERTVLSVINGVCDAGGISLERLACLEAAGVVREDEIDIFLEGDAVPELFLAVSPATYTAERRHFARALRRVFDQAPAPLRRELAFIGVAALYETRAEDIDRVAALAATMRRLDGPAAAAVRNAGAASPRSGARGSD